MSEEKSLEPGEVIGESMKLAPLTNNVYGKCYKPVNILGRRVAETCSILANMGASDKQLKKAFEKYGDLTLRNISEIEFSCRTDRPEDE